MVVDAAGEPNSLQIDKESLEVGTLTVALVVLVDSLQGLADGEIVLALLVESDVTPHQGRLRKAIDVELLRKRQVFKTFQAIAQHLQVGKSLVRICELFVLITHDGHNFYILCKISNFIRNNRIKKYFSDIFCVPLPEIHAKCKQKRY